MKDEVSPFGFHFELDKKKMEEKKKIARRESKPKIDIRQRKPLFFQFL